MIVALMSTKMMSELNIDIWLFNIPIIDIIVREFMNQKSKVMNMHCGIYFTRIFTNIALEISKRCGILK